MYIKLKNLLKEIIHSKETKQNKTNHEYFVIIYDRTDGHILNAYEEWEYIMGGGHHTRYLKTKDLQSVNEKKSGLFFPNPPTGGLVFWPVEDNTNKPLRRMVLNNYKKFVNGDL